MPKPSTAVTLPPTQAEDFERLCKVANADSKSLLESFLLAGYRDYIAHTVPDFRGVARRIMRVAHPAEVWTDSECAKANNTSRRIAMEACEMLARWGLVVRVDRDSWTLTVRGREWQIYEGVRNTFVGCGGFIDIAADPSESPSGFAPVAKPKVAIENDTASEAQPAPAVDRIEDVKTLEDYGVFLDTLMKKERDEWLANRGIK